MTSFLRTLWGSTLLVWGTLRHWPSVSTVLLGITTAVVESAAVTFFTIEIASSLPPYAVLPLLHALLLLQILLNQWKPFRKRLQTLNLTLQGEEEEEEESVGRRILSCVAATVGLCLLVVLALLLALWGLLQATRAMALLACVLALSLAWCQPLRQRVYCAHSSSLPTRQNMTLLLALVRIVSMLGFSVLTTTLGVEGHRLGTVPNFLWTGVLRMPDTGSLMWVVVVHCVTNMAAYLFTRLGAYYNAPRSSMLVPTTLSTVLSSVLFVLHCTDVFHVVMGLGACSDSSSHLAVLIASVLVWLIPFLTLRKSYFKPSGILFRPEIESFYSMNYSSVFFDQNLFLDYNAFSVVFGECLYVGAKQSRVFICTTMYREADYEMEQLLRSLSKVSQSQKLKKANVYVESHIFLDNGADDFTLKEFALQLMSLVETCLSVTRQESVIHKTPYGIQIRCTLPGGMPLFLHLKDPSLVKAKKRWSQVMYMKYILDHRVKTMRSQKSYTNTDGIHFTVEGNDSRQVKEKNNEILLQIRTLLNGLRTETDVTTLDVPGRGSFAESCKDISEQSSDQGIDVGDEVSTISDASSHKEQTPKPSDNSQGADSGQSTSLKPSSSYVSLVSSASSQGKQNPGYVYGEEEDSASRWLPDLSGKFDGASPVGDPAAPRCAEDVKDPPGVFSISDHLPHVETDCTSVKLEVPPAPRTTHDKNTFILATDADMLFNDTALLDLVNVCNQDLRLGAACGRTFPMGKKVNPIVWYQIFEYAKDFWMIKSAQNVIGSVMCCPGCFSLYRAQAIEDVVHHYSQPTTRAGHVFTKDTGEDRWMCTLMMLRGWKLHYSSQAVNSTYCPDTVTEFIKQRRRWILSDFANSFLVFRNLPRLMRSNGCFSFMYALYLVQLFIIVIFSPGTTVVMLTVGVELLTGAPYHVTTPVLAMVFVLYGLACCLLSPKVQIRVTKVAIVVVGLSMAAVVIAAGVYVLIDMIKALTHGGLSLMEHYLLLALTGSVLYAALMHPRECHLLIFGLVYLFYFPAMYMLLPLYALCNIVDQSWGTRDDQKPKVPKLVCFPRIRRKKKKKGNKTPTAGSCENLADDPAAVSAQIQALSPEEESFWHHLMAGVMGKEVNLGLNMQQLTSGLRTLRNKVVVTIMISNLLWVIALSVFYLWSFRSRESGSQISAYGILSSVLYAFSFLIQIVGMTVYRLQDGLHRLGKMIYGTEKPHYVRCADER
ncbi:hypothetical protein ACOMHN_022993 [Nucella lapillus]